MNIYFAGSIRGGREDANLYLQIIGLLKDHGTVLTEHVGDRKLTAFGEKEDSDQHIHDRDMMWLSDADVVVAEVTTVSLGVGYELGRALEQGKKTLCLYRPQMGKRLSAMIAGCKSFEVANYTTVEEAKKIIDNFLENL